MKLTHEQLAKANELKQQAEIYERLLNGLPDSVSTVWCKIVGQMREYFYLDEKWDGKVLTFLFNGKPLVKVLLDADQISITIDNNAQIILSTPQMIDGVIQTLIAEQLPERIMPTKNVQLSPGGGLCDICWYNRKNNEKQNRTVDLAMGSALCYGDIIMTSPCESNNNNCLINDIGRGTPGMTAEQVTHILFPYWWAKSRFNMPFEAENHS